MKRLVLTCNGRGVVEAIYDKDDKIDNYIKEELDGSSDKLFTEVNLEDSGANIVNGYLRIPIKDVDGNFNPEEKRMMVEVVECEESLTVKITNNTTRKDMDKLFKEEWEKVKDLNLGCKKVETDNSKSIICDSYRYKVSLVDDDSISTIITVD